MTAQSSIVPHNSEDKDKYLKSILYLDIFLPVRDVMVSLAPGKTIAIVTGEGR